MLQTDGEKFLVTGAAGQLGYEVQLQLQEAGQAIPKTREAMNILDFNRLFSWLKGAKPDAIINCAGYTDVARAEGARQDCWQVNVCGVNNLACCASRLDIPLIHISTDFVFGQDSARKQEYRESDPIAPINFYGASKAHGEHTLLHWNANRPFSWWIIRCAGLFEKPWRHKSNFPSAIRQSLQCQAQKTVEVVSDVKTNLTYAPDLAAVIVWLVRRREEVPSGIYHITNQGECRWFEVAEKIARATPFRYKLRPVSREQYAHRQRRDARKMPSYTCLSQARYVKLGGLAMPSWHSAVDRWIGAQRGLRQPVAGT